MATDAEEALALYLKLRPGAYDAYNRFILSRTPPELQAAMDLTLAPNAPKVMLSSGQLIPVIDHEERVVPGSPAVATVLNMDTGYVQLQQV